MKVITVVKGEVPVGKREELEQSYDEVKNEPLPPGLEASFLVRSARDRGLYSIMTIWRSREDLDAMRASTKPRAVAIFERVGVVPDVEFLEVMGTVDQGNAPTHKVE